MVVTLICTGGVCARLAGGAAILGGARLKIIQVSTDKPSQYLVVSPKVGEIKQLQGRVIATSDASGNSTLLLRELLARADVRINGGRPWDLQVHHPRLYQRLLDDPAFDDPGFRSLWGFYMGSPSPRATAIIERLQREAKRALNMPEVLRRMEIEGTDVVGSEAREFGADVKAEYEKWRALVKKTGMKS